MSEDLSPTRLERSEDKLLIGWSDGVEQEIPFRVLRDQCRCAHCTKSEENNSAGSSANLGSGVLPILSLAETLPLKIVQMHPVGNYAYNIHFSDGHSAGIYPFEYLRAIGNSCSA